MKPHQAISSFGLRLRLSAGRSSTLQGSPSQLSAVSWECQELSSLGKESYHLSYSCERVPLARRDACKRESLDASTRCSVYEHQRMLERALYCAFRRCPFYVIFSSRVAILGTMLIACLISPVHIDSVWCWWQLFIYSPESGSSLILNCTTPKVQTTSQLVKWGLVFSTVDNHYLISLLKIKMEKLRKNNILLCVHFLLM
jgi:hypothetical protein